MRKFSIGVHHTTIYRWDKQYGKVLYHLWKKRNKRRSLSKSWRIDETYVKVKGKDRYLYRAIDSNGNTLDMWLRNHRDTVSTKVFMKWLIRDYGQHRSIVTNKYAPSLKAVKELTEEGILAELVNHWKSKYLNNILEQDHRQVKVSFLMGIVSNSRIQQKPRLKESKLFQYYTIQRKPKRN